MLGLLVRAIVACFVLSGMLYGTFLVRLGEHTLYEHACRIYETREAQALRQEVWQLVQHAHGSVRDTLARHTSLDGPWSDTSQRDAEPPAHP